MSGMLGKGLPAASLLGSELFFESLLKTSTSYIYYIYG